MNNNKKAKVTFVIPSWHYYADPLKHQPYWEMYYATYVRNAGYDVDIFDMRSNENVDIFQRMAKINESDFYFFWIFKTGDAKEIYSISDFLKKIANALNPRFSPAVTETGCGKGSEAHR